MDAINTATVTATLFTSDLDTQEVQVRFCYRREAPGWYTGDTATYWISHCEVMDVITVPASDIQTDVETAVEEYLNGRGIRFDPRHAPIFFEDGIECTIQIPEHANQ